MIGRTVVRAMLAHALALALCAASRAPSWRDDEHPHSMWRRGLLPSNDGLHNFRGRR